MISKEASLRYFLIILIFILSVSKLVSETISSSELVFREKIAFKKFTRTPFSGKVEEYFESGSLKTFGIYKDGEKVGIWERYRLDGTLVEKGLYKNNRKEGIWEEGKADKFENFLEPYRIKTTYRNGIKHGPITHHSSYNCTKTKGEFSNLEGKGIYINGKLEGKWQSFWGCPTELTEEGEYKNDSKHGVWLKFDNCSYDKIDCKVSSKYIYKDGNLDGKSFIYDDDGEVLEEINYSDGKKNGLWIQYPLKHIKGHYIHGKIIQNFSMGDLHGTSKRFFPDGSIQLIANFKYGTKDGLIEEYFSDGKLSARQYFSINSPVGLHEYYFPSGQLWKKHNFKGGVKHGQSIEYENNGVLVYKANYKNGKLHGFYQRGLNQGIFMFGNAVGEWQEECYSCPNNAKVARGNYEKGKRQGDWHYYKRNDEKVMSITYVDDIKSSCNWHGDKMDNECDNILSSKIKKY